MRTIIAGGTGFIGSALVRNLLDSGHKVAVLSRHPEKRNSALPDAVGMVGWDATSPEGLVHHVEEADAVINLAGENVGAGRWTQEKKKAILDSRTSAAEAIVEAVRLAKKKPGVVVQGSAIGYYGGNGDDALDETSPSGQGFLADVARRTEEAVSPVSDLGTRLVILRTGVVLDLGGGALPRLLLPYRFFTGGYPGSGRQWISWIHRDDEVGAISFLALNENLEGPFNLVAPDARQMRDFCIQLGRAIGRPTWVRFPAFLMRLMFGEMADEVLLSGQKVGPKRLLEAGFEFRYPELSSAMDDIFQG